MATEAQVREEVERVLRLPDANRHITPTLRVGGLRLSAHNPQSRTGWRSLERVASDGSGAGITLSVILAGHISQDLEGERALLDIHIGNVVVRRFTGDVIEQGEEGFDTVLTCATGGFWLDKIKFNERTSFVAQRPEWVIRNCLSRVPLNQALVEVENIGLPQYTRTDDEANTAFPPWAAVGEPLLDIGTQKRVVYRDTAYNGHHAGLRALQGPSEWLFEVATDRLAKEAPEDSEEGPFSKVVVYREDEVGNTVVLARVVVADTNAPADSVLWIQVDDVSGGAADNANQIAHDAAERQAGYRRLLSWEERVQHPLLDRGSWVTVLERGFDTEGEFARRWLGEIVDITDLSAGDTRTQAYRCDAVLKQEQRIKPPLVPPGGLTNVVSRRLVRYGIDGSPELVDQPWVTELDQYNYEINVAMLQAAGLTISVDDVRNEWTIDTVRSI